MIKKLVLLCSVILMSFNIKANNNDTLLTKEQVYELLVEIDVKYPEIVLAQAILETGHFKSSLCIKNHNLFGFRTRNGYLSFDSWIESCYYYKGWQDRYYNDTEDYYNFLIIINYAEDKGYINKIKTIVRNGI